MNTARAPRQAARPHLRGYWLIAHRWFALTVGWVLALMGITGALLMVAAPLDKHWHSELFHVDASNPAHASLESVRQRLTKEFGPRVSLSFLPPSDAHASLAVNVRGQSNGKWEGTVYLDPATGQELGRRAQTEGFFNVLFKLHSTLLLGPLGKPLLAWVALAYLLMLVSGLVLWWPRKGMAVWRVELKRGPTRALYDLHRVGGASMGLVIAVSVATGAYMAWRPLGGWVTALSGAHPTHAPVLPARASHAEPMLPLDALVAHAREPLPDGRLYLVQLPKEGNRPLRVRLRLPDDPHPNGLTSVWLDPYTGKILAVQRWDQLDPGARATSVVYPLHTGELGGVPLMIVLAAGGLTLGALSVTGVWQWWRKRSRVRPGAAVIARQDTRRRE